MVGNDGYAGIGSRRSGGKEMLDIGLASFERWPDLDGFRAAIERYQAAALDVAHALLRTVAIGLDLDAGFFAERMRRPQCFLRLLRYPPAPAGRRDDRRAHGLRRHHAARHRRPARAGGAPAPRHVAPGRGTGGEPGRQPRRPAGPLDERPIRVDAPPSRVRRRRRAAVDPVLRQPRPGDRGGLHPVVRHTPTTRAATSRSRPASSSRRRIDGRITLDDDPRPHHHR